MPWMHLVPYFSSGGLLSSSWVSFSLASYVTSRCLCDERCALLGRKCPYFWATCLCIHSWICSRFSWRAVHHNSMQVLSLKTLPLPIRMLSCSATPGSWWDVVRAAFRHIWCRNHPLLRKIGWGAIYGAIYQVLWMACSILPSQVAYIAGHWRACLTAASHSNPG